MITTQLRIPSRKYTILNQMGKLPCNRDGRQASDIRGFFSYQQFTIFHVSGVQITRPLSVWILVDSPTNWAFEFRVNQRFRTFSQTAPTLGTKPLSTPPPMKLKLYYTEFILHNRITLSYQFKKMLIRFSFLLEMPMIKIIKKLI